MSLKDRLREEMTAAMRSGDALRRDTLRLAQNAAYNVEKKNQRPLTDDELVGVLAREVKTRRESVEAFRGGGREDLAGKEEAEIAILNEFLPQALSEEEIRNLVTEAVSATGATSARDMG
ncbi:MAG TPA: GatB/YqeY domain-containing protein, partial [Candidatus Acidoferrum sp.]|nr:GatB/YqeY domain-containing protein [Candidatus Acidoferrum sp.]